jgi:hypothetical protein
MNNLLGLDERTDVALVGKAEKARFGRGHMSQLRRLG